MCLDVSKLCSFLMFFLLMQRICRKLQGKNRQKHSQGRKGGEGNNNLAIAKQIGLGHILHNLLMN